MPSSQRLTDFHIIFFDVYATLIDWETGIYDAMKPLLSRYPVSSNWTLKQAIEEFTAIEVPLVQEHPHLPYRDLLAKTHELLEEKLHRESGDQASIGPDDGDVDRHTKFGQSIKNWPVFPDTIDALRTLAKHYKLCVLSNVDRESFAHTLAQLSDDTAHPELYQPPTPTDESKYWFPRSVSTESKSPFTLIITAQDVGSYKPAGRGYDVALDTAKTDPHFDDGKREVLWVAQSLFGDIDPVSKLGVKSVWIERKGSVMGYNGEHAYSWKFDTLGEFAEAVEKEARSFGAEHV
ncbi:haloalkanoic acid [Moniliophthora roreri]|uniref:Haloacid dehalogenase n=1 Tax=Moniliophthora roreri TaxID=221103 RepID=A0A0W0EUL1_MONRR|nr:haloalkanoic acid [Moniliophthora roreri]